MTEHAHITPAILRSNLREKYADRVAKIESIVDDLFITYIYPELLDPKDVTAYGAYLSVRVDFKIDVMRAYTPASPGVKESRWWHVLEDVIVARLEREGYEVGASRVGIRPVKPLKGQVFKPADGDMVSFTFSIKVNLI